MNNSWTKQPFHSIAIVGFWVLIALLLRLFHITHESLWWDEYTSHVYLDSPSLLEFLQWNRTLDPLTLPFYYSLEYLWTHCVQDSVISLRLMSIGIGLATLPLVYLLGRTFSGRRAGYIAVALMALSPVHIHHSQGIRMYVVFIFLAVLVFWSFILILEKPRPGRWLLHFLASFLLYWTHPFAGLVPAVLGGFLLLRYRARKSLFWRWVAPQIVLFLPTILYLSTVRFWPSESTGAWIQKPSFGALIADLFCDDISAFHWQFRLSDLARQLDPARTISDGVFACMILVLVFYCLYEVYRRRAAVTGLASRELSLLFLVWLILPPVMLFLFSWTVRPCMFPRYTVHCSVPLYLLLGGAVVSLDSARWRRYAAVLLLFGMFLQWLWIQPGPQRTDWRSAGLLLHEKTGKDDIVLVESLLWRDVFTHNLKHLTPGMLAAPVAAAEKTDILAAQSALCLGMLGAEPPGAVWVVVALRFFDPGPPVIYEQHLRNWNIPFERWFFPAVREVYVYRLKMPQPNHLPVSIPALLRQWEAVEPAAGRTPGELGSHVKEAFGDLAMALADKGRMDMALKILDGLFAEDEYSKRLFGNLYDAIQSGADASPHILAVKALWKGYGFRNNKQAAFAIDAFEEAVALDPKYAVAFYELGMERHANGENSLAAEAFTRAVELDGRYHMLDSFINALRKDERVEDAFKAVEAYREGIYAQSRGEYDKASSLLRQAAATDPQLADAHTSLAFVLIIQRRLEEARKVLEHYVSLSNAPVAGAYGLMAVLHIAHGELDKAIASVEKAVVLDESYGRQFGPLFGAILRDKDYQKAIAEMDTLKANGVDLYPLLHEFVLQLLQ